MIMGYPGRTTRYYYSEGIKYLASKERPMRVQLRRDIMDVYEKYMKQDPKVRLMYADQLASIGNYWNKFGGEAKDLSNEDGLYTTRKNAEKAFEKWVRDNNLQSKYGEVTSLYDEAYRELNKIGLFSVYLQDGISNSQSMRIALSLKPMYDSLLAKKSAAALKMASKINTTELFAEYFAPIEQEVIAVVLKHIFEDLDQSLLPQALKDLVAKHKNNYQAIAQELYSKSIFTSKEKLEKFLKKPNAASLQKDLLFVISTSYVDIINVTLKDRLIEANTKLNRANRLFMSAQLEMSKSAFAPDANGTMRLTYGTVKPYNARDAVFYSDFTTARGVLEKFKPGDFEFDAPNKLIELIKNKDYGQYADKDGELHTAFLTDNDITGGNSGSPVMNAKGELIGTAFDGNWEAISSDFAFLPNVQRTISVDIRYVLFIVDKLGGASNIISELTLVK